MNPLNNSSQISETRERNVVPAKRHITRAYIKTLDPAQAQQLLVTGLKDTHRKKQLPLSSEARIARALSSATELKGTLTNMPCELVDLIAEYTRETSEITGLLKAATMPAQDIDLQALNRNLQLSNNHNFYNLSPEKQQLVQTAGKYIYEFYPNVPAYNRHTQTYLVPDNYIEGLKRTLLYLTKLEIVGLYCEPHLAVIPFLPKTIQEIDFSYCKSLTDAHLAQLTCFPNLKKVTLRGTRVSQAQIASLRTSLPLCDIIL